MIVLGILLVPFGLVVTRALVETSKLQTPGAPASAAGRESPSAEHKEQPPPPQPLLSQRLDAAKTWQDAFTLARPSMSDEFDKTSRGTAIFAVWAKDHMTFADVSVATNETSVPRVLKDDRSELGKRVCAGGTVVQIDADRSVSPPLYTGIFNTDAGNLISYTALGSTGDLVKDSYARLCGVVTGRFDYSNSAGGEGHAAAAVGMFDLPENRKAVRVTAGP